MKDGRDEGGESEKGDQGGKDGWRTVGRVGKVGGRVQSSPSTSSTPSGMR